MGAQGSRGERKGAEGEEESGEERTGAVTRDGEQEKRRGAEEIESEWKGAEWSGSQGDWRTNFVLQLCRSCASEVCMTILRRQRICEKQLCATVVGGCCSQQAHGPVLPCTLPTKVSLWTLPSQTVAEDSPIVTVVASLHGSLLHCGDYCFAGGTANYLYL